VRDGIVHGRRGGTDPRRATWQEARRRRERHVRIEVLHGEAKRVVTGQVDVDHFARGEQVRQGAGRTDLFGGEARLDAWERAHGDRSRSDADHAGEDDGSRRVGGERFGGREQGVADVEAPGGRVQHSLDGLAGPDEVID
jgi:hypothetical protein